QRAARDGQVARFKKEFVAKRVAKVQQPSDVSDDAALALVRTVTGGWDDDFEYALSIAANRLLDLEREFPRGAKVYSPSTETRAAVSQLREALQKHAAPASADVVGPPEPSVVGPAEAGAPLLDAATPEALAGDAVALHALTDLLVDWTAKRWRDGAFDGWTSFRLPRPLVFDKLVPTEPVDDVRFGGISHDFRRRDGFALTDPRFTPRQITDEANYCIFCHERKKDSCAHGFQEKDGSYKRSPLAVPLEGCPLDEKIGEMNLLRTSGEAIAALAMVMIDNPMCPGTGHRICNDCMRSCIFQKQDPVNIPQIESGVLTDVLYLPWGFEIYSLLTMWNPLNVRQPVMLPYNGKNVLVVGLGPAGYTLAHYLANEGFGVVAIDGLKIEPIPERLINEPIRDARELWDPLDDRILAGFGGVSEYGITVRWDKNFLKVIRIALERKTNLKMYGGVRFGGTISIDDAFDELGFDHI